NRHPETTLNRPKMTHKRHGSPPMHRIIVPAWPSTRAPVSALRQFEKRSSHARVYCGGSNIGQLVRGIGSRCRDVEPFISLDIILNNANPLGIGQSKSNLSTDISPLGRAAIPNKSPSRVSPCGVERRIANRVLHHP